MKRKLQSYEITAIAFSAVWSGICCGKPCTALHAKLGNGGEPLLTLSSIHWIQTLTVWGRAPHLSVTKSPHKIKRSRFTGEETFYLKPEYRERRANTEPRYFDPMLVRCWPAVVDGGPTSKQHWVNVSCLLGGNSFNHRRYMIFFWMWPDSDAATEC